MKKLNLAIDASSLLTPKTGIGHYTSKLVQTLKSSQLPITINLFYGWNWSSKLENSPNPVVTATLKHFKHFVPQAYRSGSFIKQQIFNYGVKKWNPDVLHGPNYIAPGFEGPTVITVHDLSYLKYPETLPADRLAWLNNNLPGSIVAADRILTVSQFIKKEIIAAFSVPEDKVIVTYNGVDQSFSILEKHQFHHVLEKFGLKQNKYILSVGTLEPRKNLSTLISAFSKLPIKIRENYPLVLVGLPGWKESSIMKSIKPLEQNGQIRLLGYVHQHELPALYNGAIVFAFPSFYEGFGMPVIESMACGTPVIASNCASIPEVMGGAGMLLNPFDIDEWAGAIAEIIDDDEKYQSLHVSGLERASMFSWSETAKKTFQVYCQIRTR